jgi:hypothetical protein
MVVSLHLSNPFDNKFPSKKCQDLYFFNLVNRQLDDAHICGTKNKEKLGVPKKVSY